jgi:hypothetical protein
MESSRSNALMTAVPQWLSNLLAFQAGWWAIVLSAAQGYPVFGLVLVALSLAWHLTCVRPLRSEALLIALVALVGLALESLLQSLGWVAYTGSGVLNGLAPLWMAALWANFALTLNVCLRPLQQKLWLAAALGAVGGPAAYWAGANLGAMSFANAPTGLLALAVVWAAMTPLLLTLAKTLERMVRA